MACGVDLPPNWPIHLAFNVSHLKRFKRSEEFERVEEPPPPIIVKDEKKYEVEAILMHKGKGAWCLYLAMWKEYTITDVS